MSASPPTKTPPTAGGGASAQLPSEPIGPISEICNKIYDAGRGERWQEVLMAFEELQMQEEIEDSQGEQLREVTKAWGRAVEASTKIGADREHIEEMVMDFEGCFHFKSPYLSAILVSDTNPIAGCHTIQAQYGFVGGDAVEGLLERFKQSPPSEIRGLLKHLQEQKVDMKQEVLEKFQKSYILRMRSEDPEAVYAEMIADGLKPTTVHGFNILFQKQQLSKPAMIYYGDMIGFGITPVLSTFRILAKHHSLSKEEGAMIRKRAKGDNTPDDRYMNKIRHCQQEGNLEEAEAAYTKMITEGYIPDKYVFNHMISCCRRQPEQAEDWYKKMLTFNLEPNAVTFTNLITVWKDKGQVEVADKWFAEMLSRGVAVDNHNYCALMDAYVRANNKGKVNGLLRNLLEKGPCGVTFYNTCMKAGSFDWAMGCLACMLSEGQTPTTHTRSTMQGLAKDQTSQELVSEMHHCQWNRVQLLKSSMLVSPPRGTTPSLLETMRFMMREVGVDSHIIDLRTADLTKEIEKALTA